MMATAHGLEWSVRGWNVEEKPQRTKRCLISGCLSSKKTKLEEEKEAKCPSVTHWDWDWTMSDIDWRRVFEEDTEDKALLHSTAFLRQRESVSDIIVLQSDHQKSSSLLPEDDHAQSDDNVLPHLPDLNIVPKRRVRRVDNIPFPKILKSDIRHKLSLMFANAMNSVDGQLVKTFYRTFCVGSCRLIDNVGDQVTSDIFRGVKPIQVDGVDNLIRRLDLCRNAIPDWTIQLKHSYINRQVDQPGSRVVMKISAHATVVKQGMVAVVGIDQKRHVVPSFMVEEFVRAGTVNIDHMSLEQHPPDAQHMVLDISGEIMLWLDNNHRIYRIEWQGDVEVVYHN